LKDGSLKKNSAPGKPYTTVKKLLIKKAAKNAKIFQPKSFTKKSLLSNDGFSAVFTKCSIG
jgi:hypothetical protein